MNTVGGIFKKEIVLGGTCCFYQIVRADIKQCAGTTEQFYPTIDKKPQENLRFFYANKYNKRLTNAQNSVIIPVSTKCCTEP